MTLVEVIHLFYTGTGRDGGWYRVRRGRWHLADASTMAELVTLGVELAELREPD